MTRVKKEQKTMTEKIETLQKTVNSIQSEQKEMKKVQDEIKKTQEDMLEELRLSNLRLAKVTENLTNTVEENNKEHKEFDSRITELERKAV